MSKGINKMNSNVQEICKIVIKTKGAHIDKYYLNKN